MTVTALVIVAVVAVPVVLLFSATACAALAGVELPPGEPVPPYELLVRNEKGLIGYWRLGEPEHAAVARNNFAPGTFDGAYSDWQGFELQQAGALKNDGNAAAKFEGGYVEVAFDPQLTPAALTVELWVKVVDAYAENSEWRDIVGCYVENVAGSDRIERGYRIRVQTVDQVPGRALRIQASLGGMPNGLSRTVSLGEFHYVALTYAKTKGARLHIDNQAPLESVQQWSVVVTKSDAQPLRFGADRGDDPKTFKGLLDEIALYGSAFTEPPDTDTAAKHYKQAKG